MSRKPKILCVCDTENGEAIPDVFRNDYEVICVTSAVRALLMVNRDEYAGIFVSSKHFEQTIRLGHLHQNDRILESMPDGVALLDVDNVILWTNAKLKQWCGRGGNIVGESFFGALGSPEWVGTSYCPLRTALTSGSGSSGTFKTADNRYFHAHAAPVVFETETKPQHLIVTVRDVSTEMIQQQKLAAIHRAGVELADMTTDEIFNMSVKDRIELLKSNILHYTKDVLRFDVVEIRLREKDGKLMPLLSVGLDVEAQERTLYALPQNNGVTGFVAATGKSYLCEDTSQDPLFIEGFKGAKSSLTVPIVWHEEVIGTFNVESPNPRAFSESDLQFLEIFSRNVAMALNTLELLVAQKANATQESVEAIHSAVALPVDEILNDASYVMERYIGHDQQMVERVQRILRNVREIKQVIQSVGQKMTPAEAVPACAQVEVRPKLRDRRLLVADADGKVRIAAHDLLERYGCVVETARDGEQAVIMARQSMRENAYDIVIADIRLPDMAGHELMVRLKELMDPLPLILMTGFGYDPGHSIVKARQAGLHPKAILYKPFRLDQLVQVIECILDATQKQPQPQP